MQYKIRHDYGLIDNSVNVSWLTWYYRVANSGTLHTYNNKTKKTSVICPNDIYKMSTCLNRNYYLDLHGQLYYDNKEIPYLFETWFGAKPLSYYPHQYPAQILTSYLKNAQIHNRVKCMIPTNYGDFILTDDSELYVYTKKRQNLIATCVKMIYGNDYHLVYQTHDLDLYYMELITGGDKKLKSKFLRIRCCIG